MERIEGAVNAIFTQYDTNKDGYLTNDDVKKFVSENNYQDITKLVMQIADKNHDGRISKVEMLNLLEKISKEGNFWRVKIVSLPYIWLMNNDDEQLNYYSSLSGSKG